MENKTIPVILLVDDKHLGEKYEQIRVAPSFARNVLFPQEKAVYADEMTIHNYRLKMEAAEEKRKQKASSIDEFLMKVQKDGGLEFTAKVNEKGNLYGGIGDTEIVAKIKEIYAIDVDAHYIKLKKKLSVTGEHKVTFSYREVKKNITVKVNGEMDKVVAEKAAEEVKEEATA